MFGTCELSCATSAVSVEPFGRVGTAMLMTSSVRATVKTPSLNCTSRCTLRPLPLDVAVSGFPIIAMPHPPVRVPSVFRPSTHTLTSSTSPHPTRVPRDRRAEFSRTHRHELDAPPPVPAFERVLATLELVGRLAVGVRSGWRVLSGVGAKLRPGWCEWLLWVAHGLVPREFIVDLSAGIPGAVGQACGRNGVSPCLTLVSAVVINGGSAGGPVDSAHIGFEKLTEERVRGNRGGGP